VKKETYLEVVLLSKTLVRRTSSCNNGINGVITRITLSVVNIQLTVRRIYSKYCWNGVSCVQINLINRQLDIFSIQVGGWLVCFIFSSLTSR